jgi:biotin-dependent carboxylase-like uncharacterized protein
MNSIEDLGRNGFRHLGVCQSGAMDTVALTIANKLAGNPIDAAALEMTLGPCVFRFERDTRFAIGGADFNAKLDDRRVLPWWSIPVRAGQLLTVDTALQGMRAYLAIAGGFDVEVRLGSRATDMAAGFGGHCGRALQDGDRLTVAATDPAGAIKHSAPPFGVRAPTWYGIESQTLSPRPMPIRVIPGPEYDQFTPAAQGDFWDGRWTLTSQSNRMGFRLSGPELTFRENMDMLSHGVLPGVIQVPPAGQPIVLMADAQTTGGYPKIGVAIAVDLAKLAQLRPNRTLEFIRCDVETARRELQQESKFLEQIDRATAWYRSTAR